MIVEAIVVGFAWAVSESFLRALWEPSPPKKQKPPYKRFSPPPRCAEGKHDFHSVHRIERKCVSGCHIVKGHTVICSTCHTAGQIWEEPETATPTFEVPPSSGAYR